MFEALSQLGVAGYIILLAVLLAVTNASVNRRQDQRIQALAARNSVCILEITLALHEHSILDDVHLRSVRDCIVTPEEAGHNSPALVDILVDKLL